MGNCCHVNLLNFINVVILKWPHDNGGLLYYVILNHSEQETHSNKSPLYLYSIQNWQLSSCFKCLRFVEKNFKNLQNPTQNHLLIKLTSSWYIKFYPGNYYMKGYIICCNQTYGKGWRRWGENTFKLPQRHLLL